MKNTTWMLVEVLHWYSRHQFCPFSPARFDLWVSFIGLFDAFVGLFDMSYIHMCTYVYLCICVKRR